CSCAYTRGTCIYITSEAITHQQNITYSLVQGGALFYRGSTQEQETTQNNLVAIDQSGVPLHYFLNSSMFPDLPIPTLHKLAFSANLNDSSCKSPVTNLTFVGIYQKCTPLSADENVICDLDTASLLHKKTVEQEIDTYWCSTNQTVPQYSGYLFGDQFRPSLQNPQTKSLSLFNCLSNDYEAGTVSSVPSGGFFSCQSGNPFARDQYCCPPQHIQHIAAITDGYQILYCVQSCEFIGGQLKPIRLPPFTKPPLVNMMATNTVAVMTEGDRAWLRPEEFNQIAGTFEASSTRVSGDKKAGVACGVMTFIAVLVAGIVILKGRKFSHFRSSREYEEIHCDGQSGVESQRKQQNTNENPTQPLFP
uniref:Macrophage expressed 1, tandem duplicate 2 n=1 Tax=Cyprinus carpio TaxID=7962 RepID=A0A8C2AJY8_CYPCA